jgi:uncharacterized protein DUF6998
MSADSSTITDAIRHILATVFSAQGALKTLAPEYKWAGLGNLLGDYGEFVCVDTYGLTKAPSGASGYDAMTSEGKTVQIKACHASSQIGFRGNADLMLVIKIEIDATWSEVYYGPFKDIADAASYSKRDNKHTMTLSKLKSLARQKHECVN